MNTIKFISLLFLILVSSFWAFAQRESDDRTKESLDLLNQIMKTNVAALQTGCLLDYKWLFYMTKGANVPLNTEVSVSMAIKGQNLIVDKWVSGKYEGSTQKMSSIKENEVRASFNGRKYVETEGAGFLLSRNPAKITAIYDTFSSYPLTAMFAFLVPRQGYVTYGDIASMSNWNAYMADVKNITYNSAGDMIVKTNRPDGITQEVTFSSAHGFYPAKIDLRWDDGMAVTEVVDWFQTSVFGKNIQFLPKTILAQAGTDANDLKPLWKLLVNPQSISSVPTIPNYFNLTVAQGATISDLDVGADVRVPSK